MRIEEFQSDATVLNEIGERLAQIRLDRNLSQMQLAKAAGVARKTVQRLEAGESVALTSFLRVLRALGILSGLEVAVPQISASPIQQLERNGRERRRASSARGHKDWRWGTP